MGSKGFDRAQKTSDFAGKQPPQGATLKINDNTVVTFNPAFIALLSQRVSA